MPATLILADHVGRIGNRLTLYSHVIAAAEELGCRVLNLSLLPHAHLFYGTHLNPFASYPASKFPLNLPRLTRCLRRPLEELVMAWRCRGRPETFAGFRILDQEHRPDYDLASAEFAREVKRYRFILMWGYTYRCPKWVEKHYTKISSHLTVREEVAPWASRQIREAQLRREITCAIHIRQGDFKKWRGGEHWIRPERIAEALATVVWPEGKKPDCFFVCSDESIPDGVFPRFFFTECPRPMAEDLYLLSQCDFLFGNKLSTFSSWLAGLGSSWSVELAGGKLRLCRPRRTLFRNYIR